MTSGVESTRGANCTYYTSAMNWELDIQVLLAEYPDNTVKTDDTQGVLRLIPVPGVGSEAYTEAVDGVQVAGTGVGQMLPRVGANWYFISVTEGTVGQEMVPGATLPQLKALAGVLAAEHPGFI